MTISPFSVQRRLKEYDFNNLEKATFIASNVTLDTGALDYQGGYGKNMGLTHP